MNLSLRKLIRTVCFSALLLLTSAGASRSAVVVFDRVTTVQTDVHIIVLTKGLLFARGGQLVDIYLDDRHLKKILTGGDGYGYLKYTPQEPGLLKIRVRSDADSATGLLLVMRRSEKAIIIDLESAFKDAVFSKEIRENTRRAVDALSKNYRLIYLSRYIGKGLDRTWLAKENFPDSVILRWRGPEIFAALKKRGVQLQAVIGSEDVMAAAEAEHIEDRYTFGEAKAGKTVKDWDEILSLLQPEAPAGQEEKGKEQKTEGRQCEGEKVRR